MEYAYAALILNETGAEINEHNLTAVLEAADATVIESRTKALVAALEGVDLDDAVHLAPSGNGERSAVLGDGDDDSTDADADSVVIEEDEA